MVDFVVSAWNVLVALAPWLLIGSLIAGVMHVVLPANFLSRQLRGTFGLFKSVAVGVPLPLCSCAVIPVGLSIKQGGASNGATVAFLISTPQTGVDSVLVSASMLGWPFALFKVVSAAVMGVIGGWWTDLQKVGPSLSIVSNPPDADGLPPSRWRALFAHSAELLRSIWRWLVIGILVSAAISTWVPTGAISDFAGGNELVAMFAALVIAVPLYVCATASVPIAAALVGAGLPVGAALVFLMAGPATNMATIGAVYRTLGKRALSIYLTTVVIGSVLCGWLFGFLIDADGVATAHVHEQHAWWSTASAILLLALLCWFAGEDIRRRFGGSPNPTEQRHDDPQHGSNQSCCE